MTEQEKKDFVVRIRKELLEEEHLFLSEEFADDTSEFIVETLEKQIPKFVKCPNGWRGNRYTRYHCPECNRVLRMDEKWCNDCGQRLKQPKTKIVDNHMELDWRVKQND